MQSYVQGHQHHVMMSPVFYLGWLLFCGGCLKTTNTSYFLALYIISSAFLFKYFDKLDRLQRTISYHNQVYFISCLGCQPWATIVLPLVHLPVRLSVHPPVHQATTLFWSVRYLYIMYMMHSFLCCWFYLLCLFDRQLTGFYQTSIIELTWDPFQLQTLSLAPKCVAVRYQPVDGHMNSYNKWSVMWNDCHF